MQLQPLRHVRHVGDQELARRSRHLRGYMACMHACVRAHVYATALATHSQAGIKQLLWCALRHALRCAPRQARPARGGRGGRRPRPAGCRAPTPEWSNGRGILSDHDGGWPEPPRQRQGRGLGGRWPDLSPMAFSPMASRAARSRQARPGPWGGTLWGRSPGEARPGEARPGGLRPGGQASHAGPLHRQRFDRAGTPWAAAARRPPPPRPPPAPTASESPCPRQAWPPATVWDRGCKRM